MRTPKDKSASHKTVDAELAEALDDIRHGRVFGPFSSVEEMRRSLREGAIRRADRDRQIAAEWSALDEKPRQQPRKKGKP